jgi:hypothetical protein
MASVALFTAQKEADLKLFPFPNFHSRGLAGWRCFLPMLE